MNLNKGCIEILCDREPKNRLQSMNLNKGCIEIYLLVLHILFQALDEP